MILPTSPSGCCIGITRGTRNQLSHPSHHSPHYSGSTNMAYWLVHQAPSPFRGPSHDSWNAPSAGSGCGLSLESEPTWNCLAPTSSTLVPDSIGRWSWGTFGSSDGSNSLRSLLVWQTSTWIWFPLGYWSGVSTSLSWRSCSCRPMTPARFSSALSPYTGYAHCHGAVRVLHGLSTRGTS